MCTRKQPTNLDNLLQINIELQYQIFISSMNNFQAEFAEIKQMIEDKYIYPSDLCRYFDGIRKEKEKKLNNYLNNIISDVLNKILPKEKYEKQNIYFVETEKDFTNSKEIINLIRWNFEHLKNLFFDVKIKAIYNMDIYIKNKYPYGVLVDGYSHYTRDFDRYGREIYGILETQVIEVKEQKKVGWFLFNNLFKK